MEAQVASLPLPPDADVDVSVSIRNTLNVSQLGARQKANRQLALHCGQGFAVEEPELLVGDPLAWRVPVWVTHPTRGKLAQVGDLRVDARTGEVLSSPEQMRLLRAAANGILKAVEGESD